MLIAGIIRHVSSAYFDIKLVCETGCKSDAVMTYETGPTAEPWTMLADIAFSSDTWLVSKGPPIENGLWGIEWSCER